MKQWTRMLLLGALSLGTAQTLGCAAERDPINRVQLNALPKSFFVGTDLQNPDDDPEFYSRGTVTDVGYGASQDGLFTSTYAQPVSRIKWEVTEKALIGRLAYERINDTDGKGYGKNLTNKQDGQIVALYPIESHFDIRREYNSSTGEETNVLSENSSDRPWNQREYIRVDFSQNQNMDSYDFDTLSMMGIYGGVKYEPTSYFISDPNSLDAPHFDPVRGSLDITNKAFAAPQLLDLSSLGWGIDTFPACMLPSVFSGGTEPVGNCNPVEITLRQSFVRVEKNDYEAKEWDGYRFQAYGAFTEDRRGYTRNYGLADDKWHHFISRYDVWERSHYYADPAKMTGEVACNTKDTPLGAVATRDDDRDGTDDECDAVTDATGHKGSQCDVFAGKCTLPYVDRKAVAIPWYMNVNSGPTFFEGTEWATHEWDVAMRSAEQVAKNAECHRFGSAEDCDAEFPVYNGQQDEHDDVIALAQEVDDCRHHLANPELNGKEEDCVALADDVGQKRGYSAGVIAIAKMPEAIALCHSPVEANDPEICGDAVLNSDGTKKTENGKIVRKRLPAGIAAEDCRQLFLKATRTEGEQKKYATCMDSTIVRLGDLRYHQVNNIIAPQEPSSWGIMTDANDPLTGRTISASINVWTYINDLWAQGVVDQIRYIKGELTTEQILAGVNMTQQVNSEQIRKTAASIQNWAQTADTGRSGALLTSDEVAARGAAFAGVAPGASVPALSPAARAAVAKTRAATRNLRFDATAASQNRATYANRMKLAAGSKLEAALATPMMQQLNGATGLPSAAVAPLSSPFQLANPAFHKELRQMRQMGLAARGACEMTASDAPAPLASAAFADRIEKKFEAEYGLLKSGDLPAQLERAEAMRKYIAQKVHYAVIVHEMGHSVGLRHNFVSSSDSYNYRPQYWQLRTKNGSVSNKCTGLVADGSTCVGPRYYDPVDSDETDNLIWMWMQSSTMDYAGEYTQDMLGLGAYDFAAARMFYGDAVAVYKDASYKLGTDRGTGAINKLDNFGGITGITYTSDGETNIHYSQLQANYQLIKSCADVADINTFRPAGWDEAKLGSWDPVIDGRIVKVNGKYSRCKTQPVTFSQWEGMSTKDAVNTLAQYDTTSKQTRVPYGFATDNWADTGNLSVFRHDNGADPYELFTFFTAQPEILHVFNDYRRGRSTFSVKSASERFLSRYNEKMRDAAKGLGLYANIYRTILPDYDKDWPGLVKQADFTDLMLASGMAFDAFALQYARPQPGEHGLSVSRRMYFSTDDDFTEPFGDMSSTITGATLNPITIPDGANGSFSRMSFGGKLLNNKLADDKGEYRTDFTMNVGSYYDKVWAGMLMTESVDNFISSSRADFTDARYRSVSLADLFPNGFRRFVANNLTGDTFIKGVRVEADSSGKAILDANGFPKSGLGFTSWWRTTPVACFPGSGSQVCADFGGTPNLNPNVPANVAVIDPQIGFDQQRFLVAMTLAYLPENQKMEWIDQMAIWELGSDTDPGFKNRIEFHAPSGRVYIAQTSGTEVIYGKTVQKGIGARVLEYANELLKKSYVTTHKTDAATGREWDEITRNADGTPTLACTATDATCTCTSTAECKALQNYASMPEWIRQSLATFQMAPPSMKGIY